jgi:hypothetical protein
MAAAYFVQPAAELFGTKITSATMLKTKKPNTDIGVIDDGLRSQLRLDLVAKGRERRRAKAAYDRACAEAEALEIALGTTFEALMQERGEHA